MLPAKILLISADTDLALSVITCLLQSGYKVVHTSRGQGALEFIHSENPRLVILDISLPGFNSLAIIRSLRSDGLNHRIPVVIIGSKLSEEDVLIGLEVGADLCLTETFHPEVFVARIRSLLRRNDLSKVF